VQKEVARDTVIVSETTRLCTLLVLGSAGKRRSAHSTNLLGAFCAKAFHRRDRRDKAAKISENHAKIVLSTALETCQI